MGNQKEKGNDNEKANSVVKAVVYTDGGANPNPGPGGWGVHGYIYDDTKPTQGSGCKNGQPTEKGYVLDRKVQHVNCLLYLDGWGSFVGPCTNNQAEAKALLEGLKAVVREVSDVKEVLFLIDSKLTINSASKWIYGWEKNNWIKSDGGDVINADIWKDVIVLLREAEAKGMKLKFNWVKGHSGDIGNDMADLYAGWGIAKSREFNHKKPLTTTVFTPSKGYWSPKAEVNRMFSQNHWYFNTKTNGAPMHKERTIYHLGNQGKENDLGESSSTAVYSVVFLKEAEPVLESLRIRHDQLDKSKTGKLAIGRLDNILKPLYYNKLIDDPISYTNIPRGGKRLDSLSGDNLTFTQEPALLSFRAVDALSILEGILKDYVDGNTEQYCLTDITEEFYYHDEKDKKKPWKIRKEVDSKMITKKIPVNYDTGKNKGTTELLFTLGSDIAKRNTLAALAERNPKVYALTWRESDKAFRLSTIIDAGEDVGIWASVHSNLKLLDH